MTFGYSNVAVTLHCYVTLFGDSDVLGTPHFTCHCHLIYDYLKLPTLFKCFSIISFTFTMVLGETSKFQNCHHQLASEVGNYIVVTEKLVTSVITSGDISDNQW